MGVAAGAPAWSGLAVRVLALAALWAVMGGGSLGSWVVGAPAIALALYLSRRRFSGGVCWRALPGFAGFMLREMVLGGAQAALIALGPRRLLRPGLVRFDLRLRGERARVLMIDCTSLTPGTLSADLEGDVLWVHALDLGRPVSAGCRRMERRIATLFPEEAKA